MVCPQSMEALEYEVKALHVALEQVQATLTSPELARQSLKEQLAQRQVTRPFRGGAGGHLTSTFADSSANF